MCDCKGLVSCVFRAAAGDQADCKAFPGHPEFIRRRIECERAMYYFWENRFPGGSPTLTSGPDILLLGGCAFGCATTNTKPRYVPQWGPQPPREFVLQPVDVSLPWLGGKSSTHGQGRRQQRRYNHRQRFAMGMIR